MNLQSPTTLLTREDMEAMARMIVTGQTITADMWLQMADTAEKRGALDCAREFLQAAMDCDQGKASA